MIFPRGKALRLLWLLPSVPSHHRHGPRLGESLLFRRRAHSDKAKEIDMRKKRKSFDDKWKSIIRSEYVNSIVRIFEEGCAKKKKMEGIEKPFSKNNCCYFVLGGEGVGKRFFIEKSKNIFLRHQRGEAETGAAKRHKGKERMRDTREKNVFFEYDFGAMGNGDVMPFPVKLYSLEYYLKRKLLKEINSDLINKYIDMRVVYEEYIACKDSEFTLSTCESFFKYILKNPQMYDYLNEQDRKEIQSYVYTLEKKNFSFDHFNSFLKLLLRKVNVNYFCNYLNDFSALLYFLKMISQYEEHTYYYNHTKSILTDYSDGLYIYKYLFSVLQFLQNKYGYNFYCIFYNLNLFLLSSQPVRNFHFFVNLTNENLNKYNISIIFHSIKNLEIMKAIFLYNQMVFRYHIGHMVTSTAGNSSTTENLQKGRMSRVSSNPTGECSFTEETHEQTQHRGEEASLICGKKGKDILHPRQGNQRNLHQEEKRLQEKLQNCNDVEWNNSVEGYDTMGSYELVTRNLIEIDDLSYDMVKCLLIPEFVKNEEISKCIYDIVGGNAKLVKEVCKGLHNLDENFNEAKIWAHIENEKKQNVTYDMDEEEEFSCDKPTEEIIEYKKVEEQKLFLKNIHQNVLNMFILEFERKIATFFSLPIIERMKLGLQEVEGDQMEVEHANGSAVGDGNDHQSNRKGGNGHGEMRTRQNGGEESRGMSYVEFHFTVFEIIRYFLKKKKVFCKNILRLNNPILLGLIDVNIIHYNYAHRYLELTNPFYEVLLLNYIDFKYKQLPLKLKAQYNVNYVLNYNAIKYEYNLLESQV
ncbi:conserved Plasmodium protein, unknown function [Plasmodium ovale curtisi]|uniref:Uncharacterized protein n=1 Tax=Plasmodium ovale curtisi TaxID=864141 RepID=A0A1A8VS75_PLAOA|nr:conserved Plasmodium protein, unknown function [Plasmodium ovale curtisi]